MITQPQSLTRGTTLVDLLRRRAGEAPDRAAFTFLADAATEKDALTYGELDRRARAAAAVLQSLGLTGERALLLYPPGLDYIVGFFGCLYAGVIAVPAYPPRRNRGLDRLQAIVADARAAAVLATPAAASVARSLENPGMGLHALRWILSDEAPVEAADDWREPTLSGDSLAFLQYTSGSTTTPRGVMLTHANLLHNCQWIERRFAHTADSQGVVWLPPYHDMGLIGGVLQPIYGGFPCCLMSPVSLLNNPFSWLQAVSRYRAVTSGGPNFAYELCLRKITPEQRDTLDLSGWQVAFTGAEPVRAETLERFAEAFAPCGFRPDAFFPCYGLAEATLMAAGGRKNDPPRLLPLRKADLEAHKVRPGLSDEGSVVLVGCGRNLDDQQIVIVDPEKRIRLQPDEVGEIWISGPSVARGYWEKPEQSEQTFAARLADTGEGPFLRTGDLGFLHENELYVTGRIKELIILHGRNLYPHDLERTAERICPDLNPGCGAAFAVEEDGRERLVVAYEVMPRRKPDVAAVAEVVRRATAAEYDADLHAFVLLKPGELPKTSSGKIQRRACRDAFLAGALDALGEWRAAGAPTGGGLSRTAILAAPPSQRQDLLENAFREQVARLLRLSPSAVDPHQPLYALGLSSLSSFELKNAVEQSLGVTISVSSFLQGASIAELASAVLAELSAPIAAPPNMSGLLQQVQQLSDEQVKAMLVSDSLVARGTLS